MIQANEAFLPFYCGYFQVFCSTVLLKLLGIGPRTLAELFVFVDSCQIVDIPQELSTDLSSAFGVKVLSHTSAM